MKKWNVNNFNNADLKYWKRFWERNYIFCVKCYLNLLFWIFLYYFGHIEDVFLFFGLFDMIIIDFHWKGLHFSFVVETCLTWQKKKFSRLFHACLRPLCLCIYEHIWIFIENWNHFVWDHFVFYYEFVKRVRITIFLLWICYLFVWVLHWYDVLND